MRILIRGGRNVTLPESGKNGIIVIENGIIRDIHPTGGNHVSDNQFDRVIDAGNCIIAPGLIDMHVHLRDPGYTHKETIETGCLAAVHGGFTTVCAMPNTLPVNDSPEITEYILKKASDTRLTRIHPVAAVTKSLEGLQLTDFEMLKDAGAIAFSDDGMPVMDSHLMRCAMEEADRLNLPVISHCEDLPLTAGGSMNEGSVSRRLGHAGIPNASESVMVYRDVELARLTGAHVHIAHVSTLESVEIIRRAKKSGIRITAETAPHYFTITDETVAVKGPLARMNPPLRTSEDRDAIIEGLSDGTIDVIATDHAPHTVDEKNAPFSSAPNGIIGLETSVSLSLQLVHKNHLSMASLIEKMSINPAAILGLHSKLHKGAKADITIIDPDLQVTVDSDKFKSKSRNTPFDGLKLTGGPVMTIMDGRIVFDRIKDRDS